MRRTHLCELREEAVILEEHGWLFETRDSFHRFSRLRFRPPPLYISGDKKAVGGLVVFERVQWVVAGAFLP